MTETRSAPPGQRDSPPSPLNCSSNPSGHNFFTHPTVSENTVFCVCLASLSQFYPLPSLALPAPHIPISWTCICALSHHFSISLIHPPTIHPSVQAFPMQPCPNQPAWHLASILANRPSVHLSILPSTHPTSHPSTHSFFCPYNQPSNYLTFRQPPNCLPSNRSLM